MKELKQHLIENGELVTFSEVFRESKLYEISVHGFYKDVYFGFYYRNGIIELWSALEDPEVTLNLLKKFGL